MVNRIDKPVIPPADPSKQKTPCIYQPSLYYNERKTHRPPSHHSAAARAWLKLLRGGGLSLHIGQHH